MAARVESEVTIEAPREFVWERMMDVERWPELFSDYAKVEVLEEHENTFRFRVTAHPDPEEGRVWSWVSERVADPGAYTAKTKRIETGPFEFMEAEWHFEEEGGATKMRWTLEFAMNPDAPADDATAQEYLGRKAEEQLRGIKQRLEAEAAGR